MPKTSLFAVICRIYVVDALLSVDLIVQKVYSCTIVKPYRNRFVLDKVSVEIYRIGQPKC